MRFHRITKTLFSFLLLCFAFGFLSDANAQDVIRASGGTNISIDNEATGTFTPLSGPTIRETAVAQLEEDSTIVLTLPPGYQWNTEATISVLVEPVGAQNTDLEVEFVSFDGINATFLVTNDSRSAGAGQGPGRATISGLEVRPTTTDVPNEGQITNTGSTGPDVNYGNLSTKTGDPSDVLVETKADGTGEVVSEQSILAGNSITVFSITRDVGENFIENVALDDEDDWSLINVTGGIPVTALSVAGNRRSATFSSQVTGTVQIEAFLDGKDLTPSETITVLPRPANAMVIEQQPSSSATAGEPFTVQPVIHLIDQFGNLVTTDNSTEVTAEIASGSGALSSTSSTVTQTASGGVVTFSGLYVEKANTITLKFTGSGLNDVKSNEIEIEPNVETTLAFIEQPTNTAQNNKISPPVEVQLQDDFGNNVNKDNVSVTIIALDDQGQEVSDFFKSGQAATTTVSTNSQGIAIFDNLDIGNNTAIGEYTLEASFSGINDPVSSNTFLVIDSGDFARFEVTDTDGNPIGEQEAGVPFTIRIAALDGGDNVFENFEDNFTGDIELTADADIETSVQTSFTQADFTNGILETSFILTSSGETRIYADFDGVENQGSNPVTRDGRSNIFNVIPTDVDFTRTLISADPEQITANGTSTSTITVQLRDEFENNLITGGEIITLETDAGTLSTDNGSGSSVTAIDQDDGTYTATLTSSTTIETATVEAFNDQDDLIADIQVDFTAGNIAEFIITVPQDNGSPEQQTAGQSFNINVEAVDQNGNRVEDFNGNLEFSSGSTISSGGTASISDGLLEDHSITLETSGTSVTISVEDPDVFSVSGTSESFVVVAAEPNTTVSTVNANPLVIQNDGSSTSTITVILRDQFGNRVLPNLVSDLSVDLEQIDQNGSPSGPPDATIGSFSFNSSNSTYTATLTSSTTIEDVEVTVSFDGSPIDQPPVISIVVPNTWDPSGSPTQRIDWNRAANWSLGTVPDEDDFVVIPGGASDYPDLDQNITIGSLEIQDGGELVLFGGNIITVAGFVLVDGTLDIENNTGLTVGGDFSGSGTFAAGASAEIQLGGNLSIANFLAGADGTVVTFNGSVQQELATTNILARRFEVLNDVLVTGQEAVLEAAEIFIEEGNTIEFETDADITVDNLQELSGSGAFILNNNTLVVRGDIDAVNIDTSDGTVIFGINIGEDPADFPGLAQQQIQNFLQMRNAVINNPFGVRTFDDIIIDDSGSITLEDGELIIGSGRNFIANNVTYNGGTITFRRTISQKGWRMVSVPVGTTYSDFFNGLTLQGISDASSPEKQPNLLFYDETFEGTDNQRWRTPGSANDSFVAGRGYFFFVFGNVDDDSDYDDPLPTTLTASGEENQPTSGTQFDFTITHTAEADSGWNLVGNPYGATIDWDESSWSRTNVDNVIYIWDEATNQYRYWNGSAGSHGSGKIAPFQAFWIKANNDDPELSFEVSAKTTGGVFRKTPDRYKDVPVIALQLDSDFHSTSTHFSFTQHGSFNVDPKDAFRLLPFDASTYLEIFSLFKDGTELAINNLPRDFGKEIEIPVHAGGIKDGAFYSGAVTMSWPEFENIPESWDIKLRDTRTGTVVNLREKEEYSFTLSGGSKAKAPPVLNTPNNFRLLEKSKEKVQDARFRLIIEPGDDGSELPKDVSLSQNYPNPFNPGTNIQFALPTEDRVRIDVYDMLGRRVQTITNERYQAGFHEVQFDGSSLASGVYFYRLVTSDKVLSRKMTLIK